MNYGEAETLTAGTIVKWEGRTHGGERDIICYDRLRDPLCTISSLHSSDPTYFLIKEVDTSDLQGGLGPWHFYTEWFQVVWPAPSLEDWIISLEQKEGL